MDLTVVIRAAGRPRALRAYSQYTSRLGRHHHPISKAYSLDLRKMIVDAVLRRGMSKTQAARTFGAEATSVKRYGKLQEEGSFLPR